MALSFYLLLAAVVTFASRKLVLVLQDPLRSIPGPFIARFTKLWVFRRFYAGQWHEEVLQLHREHGKVVRYGPGQYSINDVDAIRKIHSHGGGFDKASSYETWSPPGTTSLFKERSNRYHGELRKRFASMYSMTSVFAYETGVSECVDLLCKQLQSMQGQRIDLNWWLECFTFDSIGVVSYGKRFGFLDSGEDVGNLAKAVIGAFTYGSWMGFFPDFHALGIATMRFVAKLKKSRGSGKMYLDNFTSQTTAQRRAYRVANPDSIASRQAADGPRSILDKFLDVNEKDPAYFADAHITMGLGANVTAGSDTTSSTSAWALFYLAKHPDCMQKLRQEITSISHDAASISFRQLQGQMPYLNAVLTETLRLFPQTGFGLPRTVPVGGVEICGYHFPEGSVVSLNAWAMHYDPDNFEDPEQFKPERWLVEDQETKERMNQCYFPFGLGSRTCIGKNIAMLVMLKALPRLVQEFEYQLAGDLTDGRNLPVQDIFLLRATDFPVIVKAREAKL